MITLQKDVSIKKSSENGLRIVDMSPQRMAVVRTTGDPSLVAPKVLSALFGAAYGLKFALNKEGIAFKVGAPRSRWPNIMSQPRDEWVGEWGIAVPDGTTSVPQKDPTIPRLWKCGRMGPLPRLSTSGHTAPNRSQSGTCRSSPPTRATPALVFTRKST